MGEVVRQFKGIWIPADIWLSKELKPIDKILLADIDSFTGNGKSFYKSNATIAKELGVSVSTAKRAIKALLTLKYIHISGTTSKRVCRSLIGFRDSGHIERDEVQNEFDKVQIDPPLGSKCTTTNTETNSSTNSLLTEGVMLPFMDSRFKLAWIMWLDERKARRYGRYTQIGEQAALHKLYKESGEDLDTSIEMINESVANGWRGIFPIKNKKNGQPRNKGFDSEEYLAHLKTLK